MPRNSAGRDPSDETDARKNSQNADGDQEPHHATDDHRRYQKHGQTEDGDGPSFLCRRCPSPDGANVEA